MTVTDTPAYYQLHTCKVCADEQTPTPLEYAIGMMSASTVVTPAIHQNEDFSAGWHMGIENTPWTPVPNESGLCPIGLADADRTKAWLIGFIAGRYAVENHWATPTCFDPNLDGHVEL